MKMKIVGIIRLLVSYKQNDLHLWKFFTNLINSRQVGFNIGSI